MFRTSKSVLFAVATTAAAIIAVPVGSVSAQPIYPTAIVSTTSGGPQVTSVTCQRGEDVTLWGDSSINPAGTGLLYSWFSDIDNIGSFDASYVFPCDFSGSIRVTFRATAIGDPDEYWEHDTSEVLVTSNQPPTAAITVDGKNPGSSVDILTGSGVTFSAATSIDPDGGPLQYVWDNGTDQTRREEYRVYCDSPERFALTLTVTDNAGDSDKDQVIVECVDSTPTGSFTPAPSPEGTRKVVPLGTKITFKPTASRFTSGWEWRTTGVPGVASRNYEFTRTFNQIGNYGVQLTETNLLGSASTWSGFTVIAPPQASVTPAPAIETQRTKVPVGTKVTLDGSGSVSPGGGSLTYQWRTTGRSGVVGDGRSFTRSFDSVGKFGIELTVVNELGQPARRWVGFEVVPAADPVASVKSTPNGSPDATKRTPVKVGTTITFDARASVDPDGGSVTYQWRTTGFNGVAAITDTFTRKFDKVGDVGVELTVVDDEGRTARRWVGFTVQP